MAQRKRICITDVAGCTSCGVGTAIYTGSGPLETLSLIYVYNLTTHTFYRIL